MMTKVQSPPGPLQTERLPDGRRFLLRNLVVKLDDGTKITVPAGFETDFSSLPWRTRWAIHWTRVDVAGVVHDFLYWCPQPNGRQDAGGGRSGGGGERAGGAQVAERAVAVDDEGIVVTTEAVKLVSRIASPLAVDHGGSARIDRQNTRPLLHSNFGRRTLARCFGARSYNRRRHAPGIIC